jgi:hypothetical protein
MPGGSIFGKPTPFLKGPAKGAFNNQTVVICFYTQKKKGYYEAVFTVAERMAPFYRRRK